MASITHGINTWPNLQLEGKTVGQALAEYSGVFNLPSGATVLINGEQAGMGSVIAADDEIEFVKETGQKG